MKRIKDIAETLLGLATFVFVGWGVGTGTYDVQKLLLVMFAYIVALSVIHFIK